MRRRWVRDSWIPDSWIPDSWITDPWCVALTTLAAARVTRLATRDEFPPAETARAWVEARLSEDYRHGVTCAWCVSWWVALAAVVGAEVADRARHRRAWMLACAPWAISAVVGQLAEREVS